MSKRYGLNWPDNFTDLQIEFKFVRSDGYITVDGQRYGKGLFEHYRAAMTLLWPEDDHHVWSDLILKTLCEERITVLQGSRDTGKTRTLSKWGLIDYWCFPNDTLTLISSTGIRELKLRIWGDITSLFKSAKDLYPWLPGKMSNVSTGIFTDILDENSDVRDIRKGMIAVPCIGGDGEWVGLDRYVGIKQKRRRLLGDELNFMHPMYVNVLDALDKGEFKGAFAGNPIGGNGKALDKIAEPMAGWSSLGEIRKTTTWRNKYGGVTINLVGIDSPNFQPNRPKHYPYLIDQADVDKVKERNGEDSPQFWTFIMGVRKIGVDAYRVLTVELCERCGAFNTAIWAGGPVTKVYAIDAGFGGDACEVEYLEFGEDVAGNQIVEFSQTKTIPIALSSEQTPEDQIAYYVKNDCARLGVPDENVFFDAGMRATLAISFGRVMSPSVNAVNFGGSATERPVSEDLLTNDPKTGERRLTKCVEQYSKFVTELHFSIREAVEAKQVRGLPKNVAEEFALREWHWVPGPLGQRYELETKIEFKKRTAGQSPNKSDATSLALEGARRLGFQIKNQKEGKTSKEKEDQDFLEKELERFKRFRKRNEINYTVK